MSTDVDGDEPATSPATAPSGPMAVAPSPATAAQSDPAAAGVTAAPRPARRHGDLLGLIGDIEVTPAALRTPAGRVPLGAVHIEVADVPIVRTPTWAVFCAIVGTFVLPVISLLFLLVKKTSAAGAVRVRVTGGGVRHQTVVTDPAEIDLARRLLSLGCERSGSAANETTG